MGVLYSQQLHNQLGDVHQPVWGTQKMGGSTLGVLGRELSQNLD